MHHASVLVIRIMLRLISLVVLAPLVLSDSACIWSQCYRLVAFGRANANVTVTRLDFYKCPRSIGRLGDSSCVAPTDVRSAVEVQSIMTNLSEIPRGLCALSDLEVLSLQHNRIWTLLRPSDRTSGYSRSSELACAEGSRLRILDLRFNKLRTVDLRVLFGVVTLNEAWFDFNEIDHVVPIDNTDASSYKLSELSLKILSFRGNRLRTVDISLLQIVSLQHLDLSANQIARVTNARWRVQAAGESIEPSELQTIKNLRMIRGVRDEHFQRMLNVSLCGNDFSSLFDEIRTLETSRHLYQGFQLNFPEPSQNLFYMLIKYLKDFDFLALNVTDATIRCDCSLYPTLSGLRGQVRRQSQFMVEVATIRRLVSEIRCSLGTPDDSEQTVESGPVSLMNVDDSALRCVREANASSCPWPCRCVETPGQSWLAVDCSRRRLGVVPAVGEYVSATLQAWRAANASSTWTLNRIEVDLSGNQLSNVNVDALFPANDVRYVTLSVNVQSNRLADSVETFESIARMASRFNESHVQMLVSRNRFACLCREGENASLFDAARRFGRVATDVSPLDVTLQCSPSCEERRLTTLFAAFSSVAPRMNATSTSAMRLGNANTSTDELFVMVPNATVLLVVAALCTVCVLVLFFALLTFHFYSKMKHERRSAVHSSKLLAASSNDAPNNFRTAPAGASSRTSPNGVCVYQNIVNNVDMFSEVPHFATLRNPTRTRCAARDLPTLSSSKRRVSLTAFLSQPRNAAHSSSFLSSCTELHDNAQNRRFNSVVHNAQLRPELRDESDVLQNDDFNVDITEV